MKDRERPTDIRERERERDTEKYRETEQRQGWGRRVREDIVASTIYLMERY